MREAITNWIMIALALAFLVHFELIAWYKSILIREPNPFILLIEVAGLLAIIILVFGT